MTANTRDKIGSALREYLAPLLIVALGTVGWQQWQSTQSQIAQQGRAWQQVIVQLATIQEQIHEGQIQESGLSDKVDAIDTDQRSLDHRVTVLEQRR